MRKKSKGSPPKKLTGRMPVSPLDSPWWDGVIAWVTGPDGLVGRTLTIEELTTLIPCYPNGRRPRTRTVARRLRPILEVVSRGPNGSLGRGATFNVLSMAAPIANIGRSDLDADVVQTDHDFIAQAVERMTKTR